MRAAQVNKACVVKLGFATGCATAVSFAVAFSAGSKDTPFDEAVTLNAVNASFGVNGP